MTFVQVGELISVQRLGHGSVPAEFMWRGQRHTVRFIEAVQASPLRAGGGGAATRLYRLRTSSGLRCMLREDASRGLWSLEKLVA